MALVKLEDGATHERLWMLGGILYDLDDLGYLRRVDGGFSEKPRIHSGLECRGVERVYELKVSI